MKWFKHYTSASDDEFIDELEDLFGWEGYGRWWKMLEIIGKQMEKGSDCSATHSWVKWQSFLKGKRNKLELFLKHCQDKGKIKLEQNGNILKIICPNMLKLRDEYSEKSRHSPDKAPDKLTPKKEDTDKEKKEAAEYAQARADDFLQNGRVMTELPDQWRQDCQAETGWTEPVIRDIWTNFTSHWRSKVGGNAFKNQEEWAAQWRTWYRKERINPQKNGEKHHGNTSSTANTRSPQSSRIEAAADRVRARHGLSPAIEENGY